MQTGGTTYTLNNITANHTVQLSFIQSFTVTPSAAANGTINPSSMQTVGSGSSLIFSASANISYAIATWLLR